MRALARGEVRVFQCPRGGNSNARTGLEPGGGSALMRCPSCGFENREGVRFCEECSGKLEQVCSPCGTAILPGRKFCGRGCRPPWTAEFGMCPLVAHCHLGLGKLYRRTGKRQEAQEHLTTAATMYREMDMRFWLKEAEGQMNALGDGR